MIIEETQGVCVIDIGSKTGTTVDRRKIEPFTHTKLRHNSRVSFAVRTRKYYAKIDY